MKTYVAILGLLTSVLTAQASADPVNLPIDLTVPMSPQPTGDAYVFDESVSFAPNFAIDQKAPALSDLFGTDGSMLCFPTSLAEALIYLEAYHQPKVALPLPGLSADKSSIDPNALVRALATACHTDLQTGTAPVDGLQCLLDLQKQAGVSAGATTLIDPFKAVPNLPLQTRDVTVSDLRAALTAGHPVILEVGWFKLDPATQTLVRHGGHYVGVYGYNYNKSWGEEQIQLKVINPLSDYGTKREAFWNTITMARISRHAGITYPAHRTYTVSGSQFGGLNSRALVGEILVVGP